MGGTLYLAYPVREPDRPALLVKALFDRVVAAVGLVLLSPFLRSRSLLPTPKDLLR